VFLLKNSLQFNKMKPFLKIGHRGAKGHVAENTLASFQKALDLKVDGVELDVHLSLDQKVMVIHDETIDRTTTGKGFVNQMNASELNQFGIPTLEEVLVLINKKCFVNIEIKDNSATTFVLEILQKYSLEKNWNSKLFQISSFDWDVLKVCDSNNSKISLGVITENSIEEALIFAKKIKANAINPHFKLLSFENVLVMHENGFKIFPWTVNQLEDITFVKSLKVDGIISDFPDRI